MWRNAKYQRSILQGQFEEDNYDIYMKVPDGLEEEFPENL